MKVEKKDEDFTQRTGHGIVAFIKRVIVGEEKVFSIVASSTIIIVSVILYIYSGVEDIKTHDEMMLKKGAGELLSDGITCKSGILYYKVNNSIALAIDSDTDKPFHCKAIDGKIFLK